MRGFKVGVAALGLMIGVLAVAPARAWMRGEVSTLAVLPFATGSVEGLTVGPDDNIYVPTFGFNATGALSGNAVLFVIAPSGKIVRQVTIRNSSPHILGLAFNPVTKALWVLDFGAGNVLNVDPVTGNSSVLAGPIANSGLNALTFDKAGVTQCNHGPCGLQARPESRRAVRPAMASNRVGSGPHACSPSQERHAQRSPDSR